MSKSTPNKDMIGKGLRSLLQNIDAEYKNTAVLRKSIFPLSGKPGPIYRGLEF